MSSEGQLLLRSAARHLSEHVPAGLIVEGSGGKGRPTFTPWVGFFDPRETMSPEDGLYVVYLFGAELEGVTLSITQGITKLSKELGVRPARMKLATDAAAIRSGLRAHDTSGWEPTMNLGSLKFRQLAYEAGNVLARQYSIPELPPEAILVHDLHASIELYHLAIAVKRQLRQAGYLV